MVALMLLITLVIVIKFLIIQDVSGQLKTLQALQAKGFSHAQFNTIFQAEQTYYFAMNRSGLTLQSPGFQLSPHVLKQAKSFAQAPLKAGDQTIVLGRVNGWFKLLVLFRANDTLWIGVRQSDQAWFFALILILAFLSIGFVQVQRWLGYRYLFDPALDEVAFINQLNQAKETFFAATFHEFGTPLTSLMSRLEMLMETTEPGVEKIQLRRAYLEAQRISFITSEQLHRARFEMGVVQLNPETIHPEDLIEGISMRLEILFQHEEKNLESYIQDDQPFSGDRLKLEQALINLITNALKHAPESQTIRIRTSVEDNLRHFDVADEGKGFSPSETNDFLQPFQSGPKQHQRYANTGLGLYLVAEIVKLHGGTLRFFREEPFFIARLSLPASSI
jgi:signal transduction histidine kinase